MADNGNPLAISGRQRKAIAALLSSKNVPEAASAAGMGERTLYRYLGDPAFRLALADAEGEAIDGATRRLLAMQDLAIDTIAEVLRDSASSAGVKIRAAGQVLDYLLKLRELRNIEQRLVLLEAASYAQQT